MKNTAQTLTPAQAAAERFALRVTARLSGGTGDLPHDLPYDVTERLRAARMQALARRKVAAPVRYRAPGLVHAGSAQALGHVIRQVMRQVTGAA
ncbi:DUF3619 family protein, partial [Verminephrobacter eiseniae]|uniref:DUF3619 family protein n=1 Tax=Verminephrobacter eiseniae TaxID=364317 RepID=UPI00224402F8